MARLAEYAALLQLLSPALPRQGRRIIALHELYLVATLLSVVGFITLLVGLYIWLSNRYPSDIAFLVMGGVMIGSSLVMGLLASWMARQAERPLQNVATSFAQNGTEFIKSIIDELDDPIRENPAMAVGIAALSGYIAGEKMM